jgi:hypothetical protein
MPNGCIAIGDDGSSLATKMVPLASLKKFTIYHDSFILNPEVTFEPKKL